MEDFTLTKLAQSSVRNGKAAPHPFRFELRTKIMKIASLIIGILVMVLSDIGIIICLILPALTNNRVSFQESMTVAVPLTILYYLAFIMTIGSAIFVLKAKKNVAYMKLTAILVGGLALSLISAIPFVGLLWFIWAILGGMLAVFIYQKLDKNPSVQTIECVLVGLGSGILGGVSMFTLAFFVWLLYPLITWIWSKQPDLTLFPTYVESLNSLISSPEYLIRHVLVSLVAAVLAIGFATLGGFLGKLLFYKNAA